MRRISCLSVVRDGQHWSHSFADPRERGDYIRAWSRGDPTFKVLAMWEETLHQAGDTIDLPGSFLDGVVLQQGGADALNEQRASIVKEN